MTDTFSLIKKFSFILLKLIDLHGKHLTVLPASAIKANLGGIMIPPRMQVTTGIVHIADADIDRAESLHMRLLYMNLIEGLLPLEVWVCVDDWVLLIGRRMSVHPPSAEPARLLFVPAFCRAEYGRCHRPPE
jgi:hypothetical protein